MDEELTPEEERACALEIEVAHIKRTYGDAWMKYYPYHLDSEYDDKDGNPYDYGFGIHDDDDPADAWKRIFKSVSSMTTGQRSVPTGTSVFQRILQCATMRIRLTPRTGICRNGSCHGVARRIINDYTWIRCNPYETKLLKSFVLLVARGMLRDIAVAAIMVSTRSCRFLPI